MNTHFSHITELWASLTIETLIARGVEHICIAPGSRSAPLTLAVARLQKQHPTLCLHTHFDERGLGFFALGLSKGTAAPVAIITTSGTAVANLYPALIEAFQTHVPLLVLSADRPSELLNCGANQAIQQHALFGSNVVHFQQLSTPSESLPAQQLVDQLNNSIDAALGLNRPANETPLSQRKLNDSGPVQINCPYRDPLYGAADLHDFSSYIEGCLLLPKREPVDQGYEPPRYDVPSSDGVIIAGSLTAAESVLVLQLAKQLGWLILPDVTSQLRLLPDTHVIHYIDLLLANEETRPLLNDAPYVLQFGGRLTSKRLSQWLGDFEGCYCIVSKHRAYLDPHHKAEQVQSGVVEYCQQISSYLATGCEPDSDLSSVTLKRLSAMNKHVDEVMDSQLSDLSCELSELAVVRAISQSIKTEVALFVGNSLSIRMMDMVAKPVFGSRVYSNRGASGIDGLVATAVGCSEQYPQGLTLLLGDVSLLHDLNSLALAANKTTPFIIVVLNNDGGAIFNLLPAANNLETKTALFQCPHGVTFKSACELFAIDYVQPKNLSEFSTLYADAQLNQGCTVIEVQTVGEETTRQIKQLVGDMRGTQ